MRERDQNAAALGRKGGLATGRKGFAAMSPEQRARISALGGRATKRDRAPEGEGTPTFRAAWSAALADLDYMADAIELSQTILPSGDARLVRVYRGLRPAEGRKVRDLLFRERSLLSPDGSTGPHLHEVFAAPPAYYAFSSRAVGEWREHRFRFSPPWSGPGELSFRLESLIPRALREGDEVGNFAYWVTHPCRLLRLRMTFGDGCALVEWLDPVTWKQEAMEATSDLSGTARSWSVRRDESDAVLLVSDPLPGRVFVLRWRDGSAPRGSP